MGAIRQLSEEQISGGVWSRPVKSANRNVIQKRLKLSGQRWTEQGARYMACLEALIKSIRLMDIQALIKAA